MPLPPTPPAPSPIPGDRWALATRGLLLVAAVVALATFRDYGSTWDERFQSEVGRDALAWFASAGQDSHALTGGSKGNLHLYGPAFEMAAELAGMALPFHPLASRHLVNALVMLLGALGAARLACRLGGHRAGFVAAALLVATPGWWGHGFANSKDIPFAATLPWILLALLRAADELPRPGVPRLATAGVAMGAGLAVRPGGLVVVLPLAVGIFAVRLLPLLRGTPPRALSRAVGAASARLAGAVGLAWVGMLALWPFGLLHPLAGPAEAVAATHDFPWHGLVRFAGAWHASTDLPRSYVPTLLAATLPESWFAVAAGALAGAIAGWRARAPAGGRWLDPALVAAAALGPVLSAVVLGHVLYDGVRHFLFVLPPLAAVAGWAGSAAFGHLPRQIRRGAVLVAGALAALALADAVRLHPYQYLYFNRAVAGGLVGASREHELDYWGATGREAIEWVERNLPPPPPGVRITVGTTADPSVAYAWLAPEARARFAFVSEGVPDLRLATTRWFDHRSTGRVLHVVERMGVPLLYVLDRAVPDGRLVLEAGDRGLVLPAPEGWAGTPDIRLGEERARWVLAHAGGDVRAKVTVVTPRTGPAPSSDEIRDVVRRQGARALGAEPAALAPSPLAGASASGWIVAGRPAAEGEASFVLAAARVGDCAVFMAAHGPWAPDRVPEAVLEMVRGARLAGEEDRRPP